MTSLWIMAGASLIASCHDATDTDAIEGAVYGKDAIEDGSAEACAVEKLANLGSLETLDDDVGLSREAAEALVAWRALGGWYATIDQVDAIDHVNEPALRAMRDFALGDPRFTCGTVPLQVLAINDFHGNLEPPTGSSGRVQTGPDANVDRVDAGGAEYLATHLAALAAEEPDTTATRGSPTSGSPSRARRA